ncbi:glucose-1-phosphate adenylyltransferase [Agarivorans sp. Toyoura001]|uniref:glucose-1-phosphate adenylyltransferase n=1 Tax=unclassified Agarivorans TaxID=2636026 RepID=UPI0010DFB6A8|nr:glucose-1-phosphate adenylyltransferase [Agarivorans sp. Toyoura001]GDY24589.1 glucose-1-phosphate adenylyltransferase [Agarivorans sp. Toyoura001]
MSENRYSHTSSNRLVRRSVALVLAGGKGTRLKELTNKVAKPAVSFGGKYRIIDFTLSNCINSGVRNIGVLTQYMAHDLIMHLQSGWQILNPALNERVSIIPAQQRTGENWYRGTADAVYQNLDIIDHEHYDRVLILGGDHIYKMDYSRMINFHAENGADVTVACIRKPLSQASSFGVMGLDSEGQIVDFEEKPENPKSDPHNPELALVSMGVYIFNMDVLDDELRQGLLTPGYSHDFGHNVIPNMIKNRKVYGYVFADKGHPGRTAYWRDVGDIDEYFAANMDLVDPDPELDLYDRDWPIITDQKQRPGAKFVFNEDDRRGYATDSLLSAGTIVSGAKVNRSLLSLDVRVEEHTELDQVIALNGCSIGKNCKIRKAIIAEDCVVPDGTVIGYNEEEDRRRFTVSKGGVILVACEMLK